MRLATWNCCGKFDVNLRHLLELGVDVAGVCEAVAPPQWPAAPDGRAATGLSRRVWAESWKELAVVAAEPWSVTVHEDAESAPAWTLPVRVTGPTSFTLVALWPVVLPGTPVYVAQIEAAVDWIERFSGAGPTVLAGDFNAPISSSLARYGRVERRLNGLGLADAYRASRGLEPGEQPVEATYFHNRRKEHSFHIDHLFLPAQWADGAKVEVGDFDTWVGSGRSDHVPLIVDVPETCTNLSDRQT